MVRRFSYFFLFLFIIGCIEPYEFIVKVNDPVLVVEGYISDKSFNETLTYPSDGRYFIVKLSLTDDVINHRPVLVSGAAVQLVSDQNEEWPYTESDPVLNPGVYMLLDGDFKALRTIKYKLRISLRGESSYESSWEELPEVDAPLMGEIRYTETEFQFYEIELDKKVIKTRKGITANISLPENNLNIPLYYRWEFTPMWIYQAPFSSVSEPGHKCWVTDENYLKDYALQVDNAGGYLKDLFFMRTVRNERIYEDISVLISQQSMSEKQYSFWREMQEQTEGGEIFDAPPFNLQTNMLSLNGDEKVVGYFGVVGEQAKRWYFNKEELSYFVQNTLLADCTIPFMDVAPECINCLAYSFGEAKNEKPSWWK